MTLYRYTNTTQQLGANHTNHLIAVKVNLAGSPVFTVLDETQAAADGTFTLEWGDEATPATENWAGRVLIGAVDDDGAVELDSIFHDWLTGTLVVGGFLSYATLAANLGALHLWEMDEASGTWLDTIGAVNAPVTGTPTYLQSVPDQESNGVLANNAYSRPTTALDITGGVVTVIAMMKFDAAADGVLWGLGDDVTNRIFLWHDNTTDSFGLGAGGGASVYGIAGAAAAIGDDKWHCIITEVTVNNYAASKMWFDGVPQTLSTQTGSPVNRNWNGKFGVYASAYAAAGTMWPKHGHRLTYINGSITDEEALQITAAAFVGDMDTRINVLDLVDSYSMDARAGGVSTDLYSEVNGRIGTIGGTPTFPAGQVGSMIQLDGVGDYINLPGTDVDYSFIINTGIFTVSAHVTFNNPNDTNEHDILGNDRSASVKCFNFLFDDQNFDRRLRLYLSNGGGGGSVTDLGSADAIITDTISHHIIWWGDGVNAKIFLDDVEVATTPIVALSTGTMVRSAAIGRLGFNHGTEYAHCAVDQMKVYDVALDATARTALFNEGS